MNISILDSWLRERLKTKSSSESIAKHLSLSSISVEKLEKYDNDLLYEIEVTTNRVDLMSVDGIAREAAVVLNNNGIEAKYIPQDVYKIKDTDEELINIKSDPGLIKRSIALVMSVNVKKSPDYISTRLESSGIRSLNNVIDITNYVMRQTGQPMHVFDYDRLNTNTLHIKKSQKNQSITTLDNKNYTLLGNDIIALNDKGEIVDLLSIMGLKNSVVTEDTKRVVLFINTCDKSYIRNTSMSLGIRTEAAQINEKGTDPNLIDGALELAVSLYEKEADGKILSKLIDIKESEVKEKKVSVSLNKINSIIGVKIEESNIKKILTGLGFETKISDGVLTALVTSIRQSDINIGEDLIEEIARIYGYHNLPNSLPSQKRVNISSLNTDYFYWENSIRLALKFWGFTEVMTYSMVSETLYEGPISESVKLRNPLDNEHIYLRNSLVPSMLEVIKENPMHESIRIFEIANVYTKKQNDLPTHTKSLGIIVKQPKNSYYVIKGVLEQLGSSIEIETLDFKPSQDHLGADVFIKNTLVGSIEEIEDDLFDLEINLEKLIYYATNKKTYKKISKYPPIIEDLSLVVTKDIDTQEIINLIKSVDTRIIKVSLIDKHSDSRTFNIVYQDDSSNLTDQKVGEIREKILKDLNSKYQITAK